MELRDKRVAVTGGAGFIGSNLVDALIARGNQVVVLDDLSTGKRDNLNAAISTGNAELIIGSVLDERAVSDFLDGADVVFHMAVQCRRLAVDKPDYVHDVNATGTLRVLEQARQKASIKRFVQVSSADVYGTAETVPMDEKHRLAPTTIYGASKLAGEIYAQAFFRTWNLPVAIVRPFSAYGYRSHHEGTSGELIPRFLVRLLQGQAPSVFGDGLQTRDFTFVDDTVGGLIAVAETDAFIGEPVNVGRGKEVSILQVASLLMSLLEIDNIKVEHLEPRQADVQRHYGDVSKLITSGFTPSVDIEKGLKLYVDWFKKNAAIPAVAAYR